MDAFTSIEEAFRGLQGTDALDRRFSNWRREEPGLGSFGCLGDLIDVCRNGVVTPERDAGLAALCRVARRDPDAAILLFWLMLPGLYTAAYEIATQPLGRDEVAAELLSGLWTAAASIDADSRAIAGRLMNGARWAAQRAIRKAIGWSSGVKLVDSQTLDRVFEADFDEDLLARAVAEGVVSDEEIDMLLAGRREMTRIAWHLGIAMSVLKARKRRARNRLTTWVRRSFRDRPSREVRAKR